MGKKLFKLETLEIGGGMAYTYPPLVMNLANQGVKLWVGDNGSGKTGVPDILTHILYRRTGPRLGGLRSLREKEIVNNQVTTGYFGRLNFHNSVNHVELLQAIGHKQHKNAYQITVDGVDKTPTGKPAQKNKAMEYVPLSYEEWLGVCFMSNGSTHPLFEGKPADKRAYITKALGLGVYDVMVDVALERAKKFKLHGAISLTLEEEFKEAEQTLADVQKELSKIDIDKLKEKKYKFQEKYEKYLGKYKIAARAAENVELVKRLEKEVARLTDLIPAKFEEGICRKKVSSLTAEVADVKSKMGIAKENESKRKRIKIEVTRLEKNINLHNKVIKKVLVEESSRDSLKMVRKVAADYAETCKIVKLADLKKPKSTNGAVSLADAFAEYAISSKSYIKVKKSLDGHAHCPTCTTKLTKDVLESVLGSLKETRNNALLEVAKSFYASIKDTPPFVQNLVTSNGFVEYIELVSCAIKARDLLARDSEELARYVSSLSELSGGLSDDFDYDGKLHHLSKSHRKYSDMLEINRKLIQTNNRLSSLLTDGISASAEDVEKAKEKATEYRDRVEKYDNKISKHKELKTREVAYTKQFSRLEDKLSRIAQDLIESKSLTEHIIPYVKTLRATKVRECMDLVESVLPAYTNAMFGNKYKDSQVKFDISTDLKTVDLVLKVSGGKEISVAQASDGELQKFSLAVMGAMREITPHPINVMFLDEPFKGLESSAKSNLVERWIPTIRERCPDLTSIFVIAHDLEVIKSNPTVWDGIWQFNKTKKGSIMTEKTTREFLC